MLDNEIWYLICIARWVDIRFQVETAAEGSKIWIRCCHQEFEGVCVWYVCMICKLITLSERHQNPVQELKQNASTCVPKSPPWLSKCSPNTLGEQRYARILKKTTFFCPVPPRGRPQTLQNRIQTLPEPTKIAYCMACAYQHQRLSDFEPPKAGFGREISTPFKQLSHAFVHSASSSIFEGCP